jgi:hypothetical protein
MASFLDPPAPQRYAGWLGLSHVEVHTPVRDGGLDGDPAPSAPRPAEPSAAQGAGAVAGGAAEQRMTVIGEQPPSDPVTPQESKTVWERAKARFAVLVAVLVVAEAVNTATEIVRSPSWLLAICAPVLVATIIATQTSSIIRTVLAGVGTAVLVGMVAVAVLALGGPSDPRSDIGSHHEPSPTPTLWHVGELGQYPVSTVVGDGADLWAIAGAATLLNVDGAALSPLGGVRHFGSVIDHVLVCDGEVLVTYDDGGLAEFPDEGNGVTRRLRYGHPIYDGQLTGTMACGGDSLYVALPLEAEVLRFALPSLRPIAGIRGAARLVTGLAYTHGALYVQDASQAAVITVKNDVPSRWTITGPEPREILAMRSAGVIVTHQHSQCLGYLAVGYHQEVGLDWSTHAAVRAIAAAGAQGVVLDTAGWIYRFNTVTGAEDAAPLRFPAGEYSTSVTLTAGGRTVLAIPSANQLVSISPQVWKPLHGATKPASGCLDPSE